MEYVTLKVKVDSADAKLNIQSVRRAVTDLQTVSSKPITISVNASGANASIIRDVDGSMGQLDATAVKTGDTFTSLYAKIAKWGIMTSVVYGPIKAFREALNTLKAVDTEMVNVQKVTDYSNTQMKELEENAYSLASAYGRTADEITAMYTTFARAGYLGDQLDSMTELGTLLANIGDISQDTASKFLLAVDAAWKLNGNESELMTVMDGLNEITNKNAVDMEALTSGITVAGSVFAEAGESVQTFSALVGAGVAATQRSGSEISRGLRTIIMNIRQIKGETEDGELIDGESIAKASNALREYAGISTMSNGQLRESSAVLSDLAGKWDTLDTVAQSAIAEALAGKRQANILTALMGNWDTVEKMMQDYANGAGSALRENEIYLDSWEAKSKQLTASWTEFVSHLVETDTIKGALDGVIKLVELLDSTGGHLIVTIGGITAAVLLLGQAKKAVMGSEALKDLKALIAVIRNADIWKNLAQWFSWVSSGALSAKQSVSALGQVLSQSLGGALPKIGIGAAIFAALAAAIYVGTQKQREYNNALQETEEIQSKLGETQSEYDGLINKTGELTAEEKKRLDVLKELRQEQEKQLEAAKKAEWTAWNKLYGSGAKTVTGGMDANTGGMATGAVQMERMDVVALRNYRKELEAIEAQYRAGEMSAGAYYDALQDLNEAREDSVETIRAAIDAGYEVTDEQRQLVAAYDRVQQTLGVAQNATKDYVSKLIEEARQSGATGKALYDLVAAQIAASSQGLNFSQQIAALQQLGYQAGLTAQQVRAATGSVGNSTQDVRNRERTIRALMETEGLTRAQAEARVYSNMQHALWTGISQNGGWGGSSYAPSGGGYSGGSGTSGSSRKNDLDNAKKKAAQATIDAIRKQRDAETAAIDEKIAALKKQNEEENRSKKLEELKLDILKKQDALLNARNERTVRQYNAATGQWEWVANPEKVKQAQEDLENAKKELREYEADVEREIAIAELEARKKAIEAAYQLKIDSWQKFIDQLNGDVETERALLAASLGDWDTYYQEMLKVYQGLLDAAEEYQKKMTAIQQKVPVAGGSTTSGTQGEETWTPISRPMTQAEKDKGEKKKKELALKKKSAEAGGHAQLAKDILSGKRDHAGNVKPNGMGGGSSFNTKRAQLFDSGGILKGMGGIKATEQDEMILPPDITARMTRLSRTGDVQQLFRSMRSVLFGGGIPYGQSVAGRSDNRRYSDHSGAEYHIGNVTLSQQQAECTTIAQVIHGLVEQSYHLKPYGN